MLRALLEGLRLAYRVQELKAVGKKHRAKWNSYPGLIVAVLPEGVIDLYTVRGKLFLTIVNSDLSWTTLENQAVSRVCAF